jgi:hypothetical protein
MAKEIKIPLIGGTTWVNDNATENEIITAVSEATIAFCIISIKNGNGIEAELKLINN